MAASSARTFKIQEFVAHESNVNCLALGHISGRVLVTGGDDKKVNLWAIGNKGYVLSLNAHATPVECVKFGHTEDIVCAGSQAGELNIWNLEANKKTRTFSGHKDAIKCMDFHPYGDFLASGSLDTTIKLWDLRRKGCISNYKGHSLTVNSVSFSPDGLWIASCGEEGSVKLWDVRIGRQLQEFNHQRHTPALAVCFHPQEFLLTSSNSENAVNFWDLENFALVSTAENENGPVRCLYFSPEGECLFGGVENYLKVLAWEPGRTLSSVSVSWGHVQDMVKVQTQLIGASIHRKSVVLHQVDLSVIKTVGDKNDFPVQTNSTSPFRHGQTTRRSFSKERISPPKPKPNCMEKTVEESDKSGTDEEPVVKFKEPFRPTRFLNRTPPPQPESLPSPTTIEEPTSLQRLNSPTSESEPLSLSSLDSNLHLQSIRTPSPRESRIPPMQVRRSSLKGPAPQPPQEESVSQTSSLNRRKLIRNNSVKNTVQQEKTDYPLRMNNIRHSPSEPFLNKPIPRIRKSSFSHTTPTLNEPTHESTPMRTPAEDFTPRFKVGARNKPVAPVRPSQSPQVEFYTPPQSFSKIEDDMIPMTPDTPYGLDLDDFLPKNSMLNMSGGNAYPNMSEAEGISSIVIGHNQIIAVLRTRQRNVQIIFSVWQNKDPKAAVDSAVAMDDKSIVVDLLGVLVLRPTIWNLDLCGSLLPSIQELLLSKYEMYVTTGCTALSLILRNFSHIIKTNVRAPIQTVGVDISREERYNKCIKCYDSLMSIRAFLLKKQTMQGKLGHSLRELLILMEGMEM